MIRLDGNVRQALRHIRRGRISNQLAAFAAIMLFASTQVSAPPAPGAEGRPDPAASPASRTGDPTGAIAGLEANHALAPVPEDSVSGRPAKDRGLNLSLFLLQR